MRTNFLLMIWFCARAVFADDLSGGQNVPNQCIQSGWRAHPASNHSSSDARRRAAFHFRKTRHDDISAHLCRCFEDGFCKISSQITNFGVDHLASSESGVRSRGNSGWVSKIRRSTGRSGALFLVQRGSNLRVTNPEQRHSVVSCPDWGQIAEVGRAGCYLRDKTCALCANGLGSQCATLRRRVLRLQKNTRATNSRFRLAGFQTWKPRESYPASIVCTLCR